MAKINAKRAAYFENKAHAKLTEFYFTSDHQCFKTPGDAQGHTSNLTRAGKEGGVDKVTRAEYELWKADQGKTTENASGNENTENSNSQVTDMENLQQAVNAAQEAYDAAVAANDANGIIETKKKLTAAKTALTKATKK